MVDLYSKIFGCIAASRIGSSMSMATEHMSIEQIDKHVVSRVIDYFKKNPAELGSIIVTTDHYTNTYLKKRNSDRIESHSIDPVPFVIWNSVHEDYSNVFICQSIKWDG